MGWGCSQQRPSQRLLSWDSAFAMSAVKYPYAIPGRRTSLSPFAEDTGARNAGASALHGLPWEVEASVKQGESWSRSWSWGCQAGAHPAGTFPSPLTLSSLSPDPACGTLYTAGHSVMRWATRRYLDAHGGFFPSSDPSPHPGCWLFGSSGEMQPLPQQMVESESG